MKRQAGAASDLSALQPVYPSWASIYGQLAIRQTNVYHLLFRPLDAWDYLHSIASFRRGVSPMAPFADVSAAPEATGTMLC